MGRMWYSLTDAAGELGVNRRTVGQWVRRGLLRVVILPSGRPCIPGEELNRWKDKLSGKDNPQSIKS